MLESKHVLDVYNQIAESFNRTRQSVWQDVRTFLDLLPSKCQVFEAGCGNGKNMLYRKDLDIKGIDNCNHFVAMCKKKGLSVSPGCVTCIPYVDNSFDATICIAVIHHLETLERRILAIKELIRVTKCGGKVLLSLWTNVENSICSTQNFVISLENSNYLVPWNTREGNVYYRYYHLFNEDEIKKIIEEIKDEAHVSYSLNYGNFFLTLIKK